MRTVIAVLVLGPLALAGFGVGNGVAFNSRAVALEQRLAAAQSAGVPAAQLTPARTSLAALRERHLLFLPFSVFSGALLFDPFGDAEQLADRSESEALPAARDRARDDLAHLKDVGGPNYAAYQERANALSAARSLADYVKLARAWEGEAAQLAAVRDQLAQVLGELLY